MAKSSFINSGSILSESGGDEFIMSAKHRTRRFRVVAKYAMRISSRPSRCMSTTVFAEPCLLEERPIPSSPSYKTERMRLFHSISTRLKTQNCLRQQLEQATAGTAHATSTVDAQKLTFPAASASFFSKEGPCSTTTSLESELS